MVMIMTMRIMTIAAKIIMGSRSALNQVMIMVSTMMMMVVVWW